MDIVTEKSRNYSFYELLESCSFQYSKRVLFETYGRSYTYKEFYTDVLKVSRNISSVKYDYYCIDTNSAYLFGVAFFSIVISGKTALLLNNEVNKNDDICFLDDDDIKSIMLTCSMEKLILSKADIDKPCVIIGSSGTTSVEKGVMLSQRNLLVELETLISFKPFPEHETYLHILPYNHLYGLLGEFLIPFSTGGKICFSEDKLGLFSNLNVFKPTYLFAPPAIVETIVKRLEYNGDFACATGGRLKAIIAGGSFLKVELREILSSYGVQIYVAYGLTECSPVISIERDNAVLKGSVGQIIPCCNVKIIDGEITVTGSTVMLGYWNDPEATEKVLYDGVLHTGDMGYIDDKGYLFLTGRKTNLIVLENGKKLIPEKIEAALEAKENISEALVAEADTDSGIKINVFIFPKSGTETGDVKHDEIKNILSDFFSPALLGKIICETEPLKRNTLGKLNRKYYKNKKVL